MSNGQNFFLLLFMLSTILWLVALSLRISALERQAKGEQR